MTFSLDDLSELVLAIGLGALGSNLRLGIIKILLFVSFMGSTVIKLHDDVALALNLFDPWITLFTSFEASKIIKLFYFILNCQIIN